jgi:hypothetical protein
MKPSTMSITPTASRHRWDLGIDAVVDSRRHIDLATIAATISSRDQAADM